MNGYRRIFQLLIAVVVLQSLYYYPRLPDTLASHFDGLGSANGWSSKNSFFGLYAVLTLLLTGVFILLPAWYVNSGRFGSNIPRRKIWLAANRIEQAKAFFRRQMALFGTVHLALMIYTIQLVILANQQPQPQLHSSIAWALGLYFLFLLAWLVHYFCYFRGP